MIKLSQDELDMYSIDMYVLLEKIEYLINTDPPRTQTLGETINKLLHAFENAVLDDRDDD